MKEPVILLTACINPNGMAFTVLQDSDERLKQYREALDWYLHHVENKIVFVENTGYDISPMYEDVIASGRLEVLTFHGNDFDKSKGKGYGEALIIEYALKNSEFLEEDLNIIKITGRLICENVAKMAKKYTDIETVYGQKLKDPYGNMEMSSQVIVAPSKFWSEYFIPQKEEINDEAYYWFEHLLYDSAGRWKKDGHRYREMWFPIFLTGMSGSSGDEISTMTLRAKVSFHLHYLLGKFGYYGAIRL